MKKDQHIVYFFMLKEILKHLHKKVEFVNGRMLYDSKSES